MALPRLPTVLLLLALVAGLSGTAGATKPTGPLQAPLPSWHLEDTWVYNVSASITIRDVEVSGRGVMTRTVAAHDAANGTWTIRNVSEVRGGGSYRGVPVSGILYDNTTVVLSASDLGWLSRDTLRTANYLVFGAVVKEQATTNITWAEPMGGYRFPFTVGMTWNGSTRENFTYQRQPDGAPYNWRGTAAWYTTVETQETLEVEGQQYETLRLRVDDEAEDTDNTYWLRWWAPHVGNHVKEQRLVEGETQVTATLLKYRYGANVLGLPRLIPDGEAEPQPEAPRTGVPAPGLIPLAGALGAAAALLAARRRTR
ncbi:MAG TPA: hypothetical protein VNZ52_05775 [Candidatus Thermoplasmatota archaeon]|nr:hypothetical protein [Candidatus Thermoplasmatota archaeon]